MHKRNFVCWCNFFGFILHTFCNKKFLQNKNLQRGEDPPQKIRKIVFDPFPYHSCTQGHTLFDATPLIAEISDNIGKSSWRVLQTCSVTSRFSTPANNPGLQKIRAFCVGIF